MEIIPHILPILLNARKKNWHIIVVSNQSGIGRNLFTEKNLFEVTEKIESLLPKGIIDAWYFCPFLPETKSFLRKPKPGMILQACNDFFLDLENVFVLKKIHL